LVSRVSQCVCFERLYHLQKGAYLNLVEQSELFDRAKMPFSHHSHSGQFCGHATGTLEEMVQTAVSKGMKVFALTEHMPREVEDFYPEEVFLFPPCWAPG